MRGRRSRIRTPNGWTVWRVVTSNSRGHWATIAKRRVQLVRSDEPTIEFRVADPNAFEEIPFLDRARARAVWGR